MSVKLAFARDVNGYNSFSPQVADNKFSATIASAGSATLTLPTSQPNWVVSFSFSPGSNIWVAVNGTAAAPASSSFTATTSELNPGSRIVSCFKSDGVTPTVIDFLNNGAAASDIGVIFYANA